MTLKHIALYKNESYDYNIHIQLGQILFRSAKYGVAVACTSLVQMHRASTDVQNTNNAKEIRTPDKRSEMQPRREENCLLTGMKLAKSFIR